MVTHYSNGRSALALTLYILLLGSPHLHAQNMHLPDEVRLALERYDNLDPLAVTWSQTAEATDAGKQKIAADLLASIVSFNTNLWKIAFHDGRIYVRRESIENMQPPEKPFEFAFDRNVLYMGKPTTSQSKGAFLKKMFPRNAAPHSRYFSPFYFRAAGIRVPSRIRELVAAWHPQSELLALLEEGGQVEIIGAVTVEGRSLVRIQVAAEDRSLQEYLQLLEDANRLPRPGSGGITEEDLQRKLESRQIELKRKLQENRPPMQHHDFYLDPECGYTVRRYEIRDEAHHFVMRSDCTQHEQLADRGIWLPRKCRVEGFTVQSLRDEETKIPKIFESPLYICQFRVKDFDLQSWPYERFELKYTAPGTIINDGTLPEVTERNGVPYTIPANPEQLDKVIEAARSEFQVRKNSGKGFPRISTLFLFVNGVGLSILVFYLIARRRNKANTP